MAEKEKNGESEGEMAIWNLTRLDEDLRWDEYNQFIISAPDEETARDIAQQNGGDEVRRKLWNGTEWQTRVEFWTDPTLVQCVELTDTGEDGVICSDFLGG